MRLLAASLLLVVSLVGTLCVSRRSPEIQEHERAMVCVFVFVYARRVHMNCGEVRSEE